MIIEDKIINKVLIKFNDLIIKFVEENDNMRYTMVIDELKSVLNKIPCYISTGSNENSLTYTFETRSKMSISQNLFYYRKSIAREFILKLLINNKILVKPTDPTKYINKVTNYNYKSTDQILVLNIK